MKALTIAAALSFALLTAPVTAQDEPAPITSPETPPKLIVAISVDQFSADLFAEYRNHFTGGFVRMLTGAVFPSGYQSHAATETCPGHSTILTGMRPTHTGIIANDWIDVKSPLADKDIYCAEDESVAGSTHKSYTVSDDHLMVPTLGERMKAANPASRVVSVSGKDRAAVMMGGHSVDELWWWKGDRFVSYAGRATPPVVARTNQAVASEIARAQPALALDAFCVAHDRAIPVGGGKTVGAGRFQRAAGDADGFENSPAMDGATLALAAGLIQDMKLGQGAAPDIIDVGVSATDHIGHEYGTQGTEMCLQLASLDRDLGDFFAVLDKTGVDYVVMLTADHGGIDLPERAREQAAPTAQRLAASFSVGGMAKEIGSTLGLPDDWLRYSAGNFYLDPKLSAAQHKTALGALVTRLRAIPQVEAVFTADQITASPEPSGPPETWPLIMRAKASFYAPRSGDVVIALKPRVTPIADPTKGYVATHGSFWDYDRRVPILFWRKGMTGFEQPMSVETIDIMPSLAALIHLPLGAPRVDGRCLDLDAGAGSTCPVP